MFKLVVVVVLAFCSYVDGQSASAQASASATGAGASASASASASIFSSKYHPAPYHPTHTKKPSKPVVVVVEKPKKDAKKHDAPAVVLKIEDKKDDDKKEAIVLTVEDKKDDEKKEASPAVVLTVEDDKQESTPVPTDCVSIVEAALATPELSVLATALEVAGLIDLLSDPELIATVLAPTNDAFTKLIAQFNVDVDQVLADPELVNILTYHVIGGAAVESAKLVDGQVLTTVLGQELIVDIGDAVSFIGDGSEAKVVTPDVEVCNSIVHVIDTVLLPEFGVPSGSTPESSPVEPAVEATASAEAFATVKLNI